MATAAQEEKPELTPAPRFIKHSNYESSPQLCKCPWERRQFTGHDLTVDTFICTACGSVHRVRSRVFDRSNMERARELREE